MQQEVAQYDPSDNTAAPVIPPAGALPLRNHRHERFARLRAELVPKLDAYCAAMELDRATLTPAEYHAARGNASKVERKPSVALRISWFTRQDEEILLAKRARLEQFLWLVHEHNPADLWEIAERPKLDEDGEEIIEKETGKPVMVKYQRAKYLVDLPDEVARIVEGLQITESGKVVTKTYSKMQANKELRAMLGIGTVANQNGDDMSEMTTTQIVAELNALGVDVKIGVSVTR